MAPASDPGHPVDRAGSTPSPKPGRRRRARPRPTPAGCERIVAIGASAGGVEALQRVVRHLPASFLAPIVVVLHLPSTGISHLPDILTRIGAVPARQATHRARLEPGRILVAPPDRHVIVANDRLLLVDGPRENGVRPAIDPLFRSVARSFGTGAIGVILSGTLDDGAAGMATIAAAGGATIAQDPADAICPGMPTSAIETGAVDHIELADDIGPLLDRLVAQPPGRRSADEQRDGAGAAGSTGTDLVCPECGGVLRVFEESSVIRFHCRVGHDYSPESLHGAYDARLEAALWAAIRSLEESASLARRLANASRERGAEWMAARYDAREREAAERADLIRSAILSLSSLGEMPHVGEPEPVASEDDETRELLGIDEDADAASA